MDTQSKTITDAKATWKEVTDEGIREAELKQTKREEIWNNYVLKGRILKQVGLDIIPKLSGVLCGLAAEVLSDTNVIVYKLDRTKGVKAVPFLHWKPGSVTERSSTRGMNLDYVVPEGRSKALFMSKTNRVLVPLLT